MSQEDNREKQRELYGAPLADIGARITAELGLTQGRLAELIGVSAPMLSQVLSGHRTKFGNPAAVKRLAALNDLAAVAPQLTRAQLEERLSEIQGLTVTLTNAGEESNTLAELRRRASAQELARLAGLTESPALADLLNAAATTHG